MSRTTQRVRATACLAVAGSGGELPVDPAAYMHRDVRYAAEGLRREGRRPARHVIVKP